MKRFSPQSPTPPWVFSLFALTTILLILGASVLERRIRQQIQNDMTLALSSVVEAEHRGLKTWLHQQEIFYQVFESLPLTTQVLKAPDHPGLRKELTHWFDTLEQEQYLEWALLNPKGEVISASSVEHIGKTHLLVSQPGFLSQVHQSDNLELSHVLLGPQSTKHLYLVGELKSQKVLLALELNPRHIFPGLITGHYLGQTGETYLVNAQGVILTPSRFENQLHHLKLLSPGESSALNLSVKTPVNPMFQSLKAGSSGVRILPYMDYRNVPVVGAWRWDDQLGVGIATEQDASEALVGLQYADVFIWGFTFFIVCLILGMWYYFRHQIHKVSALNQVYMKRENAFVHAPDAMFILDQGQVHDCNLAAIALLQSEILEVIGHTWHRFSPLVQPDGTSSDAYLWKHLQAAQTAPQRFEWLFQLEGGQQMLTEVRLRKLEGQTNPYIQAVVREAKKKR